MRCAGPPPLQAPQRCDETRVPQWHRHPDTTGAARHVWSPGCLRACLPTSRQLAPAGTALVCQTAAAQHTTGTRRMWWVRTVQWAGSMRESGMVAHCSGWCHVASLMSGVGGGMATGECVHSTGVCAVSPPRLGRSALAAVTADWVGPPLQLGKRWRASAHATAVRW
jgi:hypothetical protein